MKKFSLIRKLPAAVLAAVLLAGTAPAAPAEAVPSGSADAGIPIRVSESVMRTGNYLYRVKEDGTAELTEYAGTDEVKEIPAEIAGYKVTSIGERCFSNEGNMNFYTDDYPAYFREYIRTVTVPEGVVSIGDYAFEDCFNLIEVTLPESLRTIGEGAFSGCGSLTAAALPEGLAELGAYAFRNCGSLTRLNLPDSLQIMGANPFAGCSHLARLELSPFHTAFRYDRGMLYDLAQNSLVCATAEAWGERAELPEGIRIIGESALAGTPFREIVLPESLAAIGSCAFSSCANLREMMIPGNVETIGDNPFRGCALEALTVPEGQGFAFRDGMLTDERDGRLIAWLKVPAEAAEIVLPAAKKEDTPPEEITADGVRMRLLTRKNGWRQSGKAPEETFAVPDGIREIGAYAFDSARFTAVTLPDSVIKIGAGAFENCENLKECRLPAGITEIPDRLFSGCLYLEEAVIPEGVVSVGAYAFSHTDIQEITLPSSVKTLGKYAFRKCEKLRKAVLSENMTEIPKGAFAESGAEEITIPAGIREIGEEAFASCEQLNAVNLPEGITRIPAFCFYDSGIGGVRIPAGVTYIGDHAFRTGEYIGSKLNEITIPDSVRFIGDNAFSGALISEITIPAGLDAIGRNAFASCYYLGAIRLQDGLRFIGEEMFSYCSAETVEIPDSVMYIGSGAFLGDTALKSARLPSGRTETGGNPFAGCTGLRALILAGDHPNLKLQGNLLTDVPAGRIVAWLPLEQEDRCDVPQGTVTIGKLAFINAEGLKEVTLPESLRVIEDEAFSNNFDLETVVIPEGVEVIGDSAFSDTAVDTTRLPDTLKRIGRYAFHGTDEVVVPASVEWIGMYAFGTMPQRIEFTNGPVYLEACPYAYDKTEIILPEDHPTLEMSGGNLYDRVNRRLIVLLTDEPVKAGTLVIEEGSIWTRNAIIPESVRLIRLFGGDWYSGIAENIYAVPGSVAEAFFEQGLEGLFW